MKIASFETLERFQHAIQNCRVTVDGKHLLALTDGLGMAVTKINELRKTGKKALFIGNGGSAAIASHQALDLWNHGKIPALAFNDSSLLTCMANDYGYENVFSIPIQNFAEAGDLLIAISSSGKSGNILKATQVAEQKGCDVISFSGFEIGNPLAATKKLHFYVPSDSYGVVEAAHFLLIHSIIDEVSRLK